MSQNVDRFSAVVSRNSSNISPTNVKYSITYDYAAALQSLRSDRDDPYTLTEWLVNTGETFGTPDEYIASHMQYIKTWYSSNNNIKTAQSGTVVGSYEKFLREILLVYSSQEEQRYLRNLDWSSPYDMDIAVPFFAKRLREVVTYIVEQREKARYQKTKNSFRGSTHGITKSVYDEILQLIQSERYYLQFGTNLPDPKKVAEDLSITIDEKYDTTSSYNNTPGGDSTKNTRVQQTGFDLNIFADFDKAVTNTLQAFPQTLTEDGTSIVTDNQLVVPNTDYTSNDVNILDKDYFTNYTKDKSTLNLHQHKKWYSKYMGTDTYYLSSSNSGEYVLDLLATGTNKGAHHININYPTVAYIPNDDNIVSRKKIGGFFAKTGLSHAYSLLHSYSVDITKIIPETLYTFPDPAVYGNDVDGISHEEDFRWMKADRSNDHLLGDIVDDSQMQKMYAYQSGDETNIYPKFGISRISDNFDFWKGDNRDVWANEDIYSIELAYNYAPQYKQRTSDLLLGERSVIKYSSDIYGNDFALLKRLPPEKIEPDDDNIECACTVLDGEHFWDDTTWETPSYNTLVDGTSAFLGFPLSSFNDYVYGSYFSPYDCSCFACFEPRGFINE